MTNQSIHELLRNNIEAYERQEILFHADTRRFLTQTIAAATRKAFRFILLILVFLGVLSALFYAQLPNREEALLIAQNLRFEIDTKRPGHWNAITPVYQPLERLPDHVAELLILAEDRRFRYHPGIDPLALVRAARTGHGGASTLTQQSARMLLGADMTRSYIRKFREALFAVKLEWSLRKSEILEVYLANAYFGSGAYGIQAAAREFFGKNASSLTVLETAVLIAQLPRPARNYKTDRERSVHRGRTLLDEYESRRKDPIPGNQKRIRPGTMERPRIDVASIYDAATREQASVRGCGQRHTIVTTINVEAQIYGELAVSRYVHQFSHRDVSQGALVSVGTDGRILALVPTVDRSLSQFDHSLALRSPASTVKPLVFLAALQALDQQRSSDHRALTAALARSDNDVSKDLVRQLGTKTLERLAAELGFSYEPAPDSGVLGYGLGVGTTTLRDLTGFYATLNGDGEHRVIPFLTWGSISFSSWRFCRRHQPSTVIPTGIDRAALAALQKMLQATVSVGTGRRAQFASGAGVSGKSGTSSRYHDAWFIGHSNGVTTGVWAGNSDNRPMKQVTGGSLPAVTFRNYMANLETVANLNRGVAKEKEVRLASGER